MANRSLQAKHERGKRQRVAAGVAAALHEDAMRGYHHQTTKQQDRELLSGLLATLPDGFVVKRIVPTKCMYAYGAKPVGKGGREMHTKTYGDGTRITGSRIVYSRDVAPRLIKAAR